MVDERTALRVANQEREAHARTLKGIYGPEALAEARAKGLFGIVEILDERSGHWLVKDIIMDETHKRPFPGRPYPSRGGRRQR